ncbi:MAG: lysophospholipid acyltransferase family protein [Elusimicrobiota bacterium]|jgi:predicted LPLAT superfamily acyltransferase|nr:lysophospholipid acyltransferase family protein [Elusimicrobiota bacterium]
MPNKWSSKSAASHFFHEIFYVLIKIGGRHAAYALLFFVVIFYAVLPSTRRKSYPYLKRRFPEAGFWAKQYHVFMLAWTFGKVLLDRSILGITGKIDILSSREDQALCKELYSKGKGLIVVSAHAGCWQSAMSSFDFIEGDKYAIYRRTEEDVDKQAYEHGKIKQAVNFINPSGYAGGAVEILCALEKNGVICTMGDREFGPQKTSVRLPFLGADIRVPASVYRIAAFYGTPVIIIFFPFKGAGKFDSVIADHFFIKDKGSGMENYKDSARRFIKAFENFCKEYPYQYFNFYDIWNID